MHRWACGSGGQAIVDASFVEAYFAATFGHRHHLVSLVRYALLTSPEDDVGNSLATSGDAFDPDRYYCRSPSICILSDVYDCARLLDNIEHLPDGSGLLEESEAGERGAYLVARARGKCRTYRIDSGVEAILDLFDEPRTCNEVARWLRGATEGCEIPPGFFEELVESGMLVASARSRPS
jgi:hypothetical protein